MKISFLIPLFFRFLTRLLAPFLCASFNETVNGLWMYSYANVFSFHFFVCAVHAPLMCESMRACRTINNFRDSLVRRMRLHKKRNDEIEEVKRHRTELDRQPFHVLNRGRERERVTGLLVHVPARQLAVGT